MSKFRTLQAAVVALGLGLGGLYYLEENHLSAYSDVTGTPTICAGLTQNVKLGDNLTERECLELNTKEYNRTKAVLYKHVKYELTPEVEASMIWFIWNIGETQFVRDSLVYKKLMQKDIKGACTALLRCPVTGKCKGFVHSKGVYLPGLVNRRRIEQEVCYAGL